MTVETLSAVVVAWAVLSPTGHQSVVFAQDAYRPGPGVQNPVLLGTTNPTYTPAALNARIQGDVELEIVVGVDGQVGDIRIARSLDKTFGLDDAAVAAVRGWTFKPGTLNGQPVPVIQRVLESFHIAPNRSDGTTGVQVVPVDDDFANARRPGAGLTPPVMLKHADPHYTRDALRHKIAGTVILEAVVEKDGRVGPVRVVRSLDSVYGLDDAAVAAAKQWTFQPGVVDGQPARVIVTLSLEFKFH